MIQSKATAALMRLKEIDRKYSVKRNEAKLPESNVSTESTLSSSLNSPRGARNESSKYPPRSKLDVRMPDTRLELRSPRRRSEASENLEAKSQESTDISFSSLTKQLALINRDQHSKVNSDAGKSSESELKIPSVSLKPKSRVRIESPKDSSASHIEENLSETSSKNSQKVETAFNSVENSVEIGKTNFWRDTERSRDVEESASGGSSSRSEIEEEIPSVESIAENSESSKRGESLPLEMDMGKSEQAEKSSHSKKIAEPSVAKLSKILREVESEISGTKSKSIDASSALNSVEKRAEIKSNEIGAKDDKEMTEQNEENSDDSKHSDETTGDTSSKYSENVREIQSDENLDTEFSSRIEKIANDSKESDYQSDTFEDASSSTVLVNLKSKSIDEVKNEDEDEDTVRSGIKHIQITPRKESSRSSRKEVQSQEETLENERPRELVELVPPRALSASSECELDLDAALSSHVRNTLDESVEHAPLRLLKPTNSNLPSKTHKKKSRRRATSSNDSLETEGPRRKQNVETVSQKTKIEVEMKVDKDEDEDKDRDGRSVLVEEKSGENVGLKVEERVSVELRVREEDVTGVLRKLNREAIDAIARRHRIEKSSESHVDSARRRRKISRDERPSDFEAKINADGNGPSIQENILMSKHSVQEHKSRGRRSRARRDTKTTSQSKNEEKFSQPESKHMQRTRKRMATLTLQQEREEIRNYLHELESTRLKCTAGDSFPVASTKPPTLRPLEFPKIAAYAPTESGDLDFKSMDPIAGLRDRVSTVRRWLKDQYALYQEYSDVARILNAKYVPASLEDAKKTIRLLQRATVKTR